MLADQQGLWNGSAEATNWKLTGPPVNRLMSTCFVQTAGVELVCTTTYSPKFLGTPTGAWRSADNGRHWKRVPLQDDSVIYMATNPKLPGVVAAYLRADSPTGGPGNGGIWLSRDAGLTWKRVNVALATTILPIGLALLPGLRQTSGTREATIVFITSSGMHISRDNGRVWSVKSLQGSTFLAFAVSRANPSILFVSTLELPEGTGEIWEGWSSASAWVKRWKTPPTGLLVSAGDSVDDLYGYTSEGQQYFYRAYAEQPCVNCAEQPGRGAPSKPKPCDCVRYVINKGTAPTTSDQIALAVDARHPDTIYSAWSFPLRLYRSDDGGHTWRKLLGL
jgi:hypothetical protein